MEFPNTPLRLLCFFRFPKNTIFPNVLQMIIITKRITEVDVYLMTLFPGRLDDHCPAPQSYRLRVEDLGVV